jgi:hypothetical protein
VSTAKHFWGRIREGWECLSKPSFSPAPYCISLLDSMELKKKLLQKTLWIVFSTLPWLQMGHLIMQMDHQCILQKSVDINSKLCCVLQQELHEEAFHSYFYIGMVWLWFQELCPERTLLSCNENTRKTSVPSSCIIADFVSSFGRRPWVSGVSMFREMTLGLCIKYEILPP